MGTNLVYIRGATQSEALEQIDQISCKITNFSKKLGNSKAARPTLNAKP